MLYWNMHVAHGSLSSCKVAMQGCFHPSGFYDRWLFVGLVMANFSAVGREVCLALFWVLF